MTWKTLQIFTITLFAPLLTSCAKSQTTTSSCGVPVKITVGNSSKQFQAGNCAGMFVAGTAASLRVQVGQTLTLSFHEKGMSVATSSNPKVLALTSQRSLAEQFRATSPGVSQIDYPSSISACNYTELTSSKQGYHASDLDE